MENEMRYNRTSEVTKTKKTEKKKDYITRLIAVQLIVCFSVFAIMFITKKTNERMYNEVKDKFLSVMAYSFTKNDAVSAFKAVSDFIFMPADEWARNSQQTTEGQTEENTAEETQPQKLGMGGVDIDAMAVEANASFAQYCISTNITVPVHGKISSDFGYRIHPIRNEESFHSGIDIAADEGERISAAFYGKVIKAEYSKSAGNYIIMEHEGGIKTVYMHCSKLNVEEGSYIREGETIGYVGSTGVSTGPHLHFEIRINDITYNPSYVFNIVNDEI